MFTILISNLIKMSIMLEISEYEYYIV